MNLVAASACVGRHASIETSLFRGDEVSQVICIASVDTWYSAFFLDILVRAIEDLCKPDTPDHLRFSAVEFAETIPPFHIIERLAKCGLIIGFGHLKIDEYIQLDLLRIETPIKLNQCSLKNNGKPECLFVMSTWVLCQTPMTVSQKD